MTPTYSLLLDLLGNTLFQKEISLPEQIDWNELLEEAKFQTVVLLAMKTAANDIPVEEKKTWLNLAMQYIVSREQLLTEQKKVIAALEENNIPCAILKGSSSAMWYPDPGLRVMGDIDLLVEPSHQWEAVAVLQRNGYGDVLDEDHHCHLTLSKGRISVEIHKEPNGLFINEDSDIADKLSAFFADAVQRRQVINGLPVLADDQQAVVLILHKLEHFLSGGLGLRQLCDWAVFAEKRMTLELWDELRPMLKECGLLQFTNVITRACVDYLGLPGECVPWAADGDPVLAGEVVEHIFASGNFGNKGTPYGQRYFIDFSTKSRMGSFIKTVISASQKHWPICARYPILMPIAPFVAYGKYLLLRIQGKRPALQPVKLYKGAEAKHRLYRELKPFVKE